MGPSSHQDDFELVLDAQALTRESPTWTAARGLALGYEPEAGGILSSRPGVAGSPPFLFGED